MQRALRVLVVLAILALPFAVLELPAVRAAFVSAVALMRGGGAWGVALYVAVYALGAVLTAPFALLSGTAGYAYGPVRGLLVASPANVLAATTAFLFGRFVLSARITPWAERIPRWHAMRRALLADPLRIAALLRLTPFAPQNLLSYAFSLTGMRVRTFMLATWLGMLPVTCFQVYVGSLVRDASELLDGKLGPWAAPAAAVGLAVTAGTVVMMARLARRALAASGVLLEGASSR